jgi:exonuclease III
MAKSLRIAAWNSNGLHNHVQEISLFLTTNKADILLISDSHSTEQTVINTPYYTIYYPRHPDGTSHTGSAIIIKTTSKHFVQEPYITNKIQSTIIKTTTMPRIINIAAIYSPPRHLISSEEYEEFLFHLGPHFIVAGDWNTKYSPWESRLITLKGRNLLHVIQHNNLNYLSTGEPTYWPADLNKNPELLDFAITNGISSI